jgi:deoxyribodipyrimidine photo-lyase
MENLAVVLVRNDRRLLDHEGLDRARSFERFLVLALLPPQWDWPDRIAPGRKRFIEASLNAFAAALGPVPLHFTRTPATLLAELRKRFRVTVVAEAQGAQEEERELRELAGAELLLTRPNTIFERPKLFPTFTPFRRELEKAGTPLDPAPRVTLDPARAVTVPELLFRPFPVPALATVGEANGLSRARAYLDRFLPSYVDTRNYLEAEDASSRFSSFLANGELSARWLYREIRRRDPANWLAVELLWREFFWQHGAAFALPATGRRVPDWEEKLAHPLARAIYNELVATGYISNRSRQILASYLLYDVGLDWKLGGAVFEAHLHDYDVFVNWGNWQYVAGVKFDPRGGRRFNLDLQLEKYDPAGTYVRKWRGPGPS